ncbi:hypothetical protein MPTA5024_18135 [Microbispora sp. ATCC PTA-5024]|nr:hypothetical protein MPTA5024_18135 [Microbispora sp. ATCC PTA-5024]
MTLDRTMIAKIEAGTRRVDALELARLSAILDVPLGLFLVRPPSVVSRRRDLTEDTATDVARQSFRLETALGSWLADVRQLIDLGELIPSAPARYPDAVQDASAARAAAQWVRRRLDLGFEPPTSLLGVCERLGQMVAVVDAPGDGASLVDDGVAVAVVSGEGDPGRRRATAAHELGHLVIGDEYSSDLGVHASRAERENIIDAFAAELLLPVGSFADPVGETRELGREALVTLAATYKTSWSLTLRQAVAAGATSREHARELRHANPTRAELMEAVGWAPQPDLDRVRVPPSYAHAVLQAWKRSLITSSRAVELMRGQIEESDLPPRHDPDLEP